MDERIKIRQMFGASQDMLRDLAAPLLRARVTTEVQDILDVSHDRAIEIVDAFDKFVAAPLEGEERDRAFAAQVARIPIFGEHQEKAGRMIPVVALRRATD